MLQFADPFKSGVLDKEVHKRLVADIDNIARDAAIQPRWIWTALAQAGVSEAEIAWVKRFLFHRQEGTSGLCLVGDALNAEDRMAALAGALVRNFIRARVFTVGQLLDMLDAGTMVEASCLLIPNFFVSKAEGGGLPYWKVQMLYDLLVERHLRGLQTIVSVGDLAALGSQYGTSLSAHIKAHYTVVEV